MEVPHGASPRRCCGVLSSSDWCISFCSRVLSRIRLFPAAKAINTFQGADADRNGWLTAAEYATTAPPPRSINVAVVNKKERVRMIAAGRKSRPDVKNFFKQTLRSCDDPI
jgi:hypothetical protein